MEDGAHSSCSLSDTVGGGFEIRSRPELALLEHFQALQEVALKLGHGLN